jgi:hypothetical protein
MKISNKITRTEIKKSKEKMIHVYFLWNREKKGKKKTLATNNLSSVVTPQTNKKVWPKIR